MADPKDFFISHNQSDRPWAEWLAWTLEEAGYSVIIDAWDFQPGGNFALEMDKAAKQSHKTIAVLSESYLQAVYTQAEWAAAFAKDPTSEKGSLVTVRVSPCEPEGILGMITRVDVFGLDEATAQLRVLEALKERAKPAQKPNFPGSDLPVQRVPFPGEQPENHGVDLTVMFREAFPKRIEKWSDRQQDLLQAVQDEVQQRLDDVLNDDVLIPLAMLEQPEQVDRSPLKPRRKLETLDGITDLTAQPMLEVFCQAKRKLLILGDPGAGKTTTLLTLAKELTAGAIATPGTVLPIIFELSAWKDDKQPIRDWLKVQLKEMETFKIQPKESEQWLTDKLLLPLLDGLGMERQQKCIAAINQFVAQFAYPHLVVCCRNEEYREAAVTLGQLKGAVSLESLGDEQIRRYLLNVGQRELWEALETQPEMGAMLADDEAGKPGILRVPLLLSFVAVAYEGRSFSSKTELLKAYVERRLSWNVRKAERKALKGKDWVYSVIEKEPEQPDTQHYLNWLADKLRENYQTELLLEQIQPWWLSTTEQRWQYKLAFSIIFGLTTGLVLIPLAGLNGRLIAGLVATLLVVLMIVAITVLLPVPVVIEPVESFRISIKGLSSPKVRQKIVQSLILGLITFIVGLVLRLKRIDLISVLILSPVFNLIPDLIVHLKQDLRVRSRPNQGIWNSFRNTLFISVVIYSLGILFSVTAAVFLSLTRNVSLEVLLVAVWERLSESLISGALVALLLGFCVGGGLPFIQHFCLRFILTLNHYAPWRYVRFLNYCVERRLLQRVGGRYRFLHRELLEHFAQRS